MMPRKPLSLVLPLFLASLAAAENAPGKVDPALPAALGISEEQILDLCAYTQDVLSVGKQSYWSTYCEPAPKEKELSEAQRFFKSDFDSHVFNAPNRKAQVQELSKLFTEGELAGVKDDSNREKSQQVYLCMVKTDCFSGKPADQLADPDEDRAERRHQHQGLEVVAHGRRLPNPRTKEGPGRTRRGAPNRAPPFDRSAYWDQRSTTANHGRW